MSSTMKMVGDLIFNRLEGLIKHKRTGEVLVKLPVKPAWVISLLAEPKKVAIDSTGIKHMTGFLKLHEEFFENALAAVFGAAAESPSATDAEVKVRLKDSATGDILCDLVFSGEGGTKEAKIDPSELTNRKGHNIYAVIEVTAASATSGATQLFSGIWLIVIYDFSK